MYSRLLRPPDGSFFLFGPRGTGKSSWVRTTFPKGLYFDLLDSDIFFDFHASPRRLGERVAPGFRDWVILDEVQKIPEILDEVHRLIEARRLRFVLTGSSARKLRRKGVNLLAGRAVTRFMHPLAVAELGAAFDLKRSLLVGHLPAAQTAPDLAKARDFLASYVTTYLREEIQQEGLTRNIGAFARFLEAASLSQGSLMNISSVARECGVQRKVVENYMSILEDLLIAQRIPIFTRRAKREMANHPKFYFFDVGVYRALRPRGPLDSPEEIEGPALETLLLQELRALIDVLRLDYQISTWNTRSGEEVDFVLYGEKRLLALEVKRAATLRSQDFRGLRSFCEDYKSAKPYLFYGGTRSYTEGACTVMPLGEALRKLPEMLGSDAGQP